MTKEREFGLGTAALHAGYRPIPMDMTAFRSFVPPVIQSAIYHLSDVDHYTRIVNGLEPGYDYGRNSNPTVDVLQKRLAALEGGEAALATPSGMHACFVVTRHLTKVGDEFITSHRIFGEAYELFFLKSPGWGITPRLVQNPEDLGEWERLITPKTRFLWVETPGNPTLFVTDIAGLAEIAHAHGLPLIVDNTLATPMLQHPLELGADIVVHSLTKFMTGNGTIVGGSVVGNKELIRKMVSTIAAVGSIMSPFDAWLALLSLETLPLRIARHSSNAEQVAAFLAQLPKIKGVNWGREGRPARKKQPLPLALFSALPARYQGLLFGLLFGLIALVACVIVLPGAFKLLGLLALLIGAVMGFIVGGVTDQDKW